MTTSNAAGAPPGRAPRRRLAALRVMSTRAKVTTGLILAMGVLAVAGVLFRGEDRSARTAPTTATFLEPRLGFRFAYPPTWQLSRRGPSVRVISEDRSITIAFVSPTSGYFVGQVRRDTERVLLARYRPARIVGRVRARLGRRRAIATEIIGTDPSGDRIRILSVVGGSRFRTYAVAVYSALPPRAARMIEAQQILRTVAFGRPRLRG